MRYILQFVTINLHLCGIPTSFRFWSMGREAQQNQHKTDSRPSPKAKHTRPTSSRTRLSSTQLRITQDVKLNTSESHRPCGTQRTPSCHTRSALCTPGQRCQGCLVNDASKGFGSHGSVFRMAVPLIEAALVSETTDCTREPGMDSLHVGSALESTERVDLPTDCPGSSI